jgi:hypothetical protein
MPKSSPAKLKYQTEYNSRPSELAKRKANGKARYKAIKAGQVKVGDLKDVAHIQALDNGGTNAPSNLKVQSRTDNRGWRTGKSGYKV